MPASDYREKCLSQKINACYACGDTDSDLVVHHMDGDHNNHDLDNLIPMCESCHSRLHTSKGLDGTLGRLQEKLPKSTLSWTDEPSERHDEGRATARIAVTESTKERVDEDKPDGVTYDFWFRQKLGLTDYDL